MSKILAEDGSAILTEDGGFILLEKTAGPLHLVLVRPPQLRISHRPPKLFITHQPPRLWLTIVPPTLTISTRTLEGMKGAAGMAQVKRENLGVLPTESIPDRIEFQFLHADGSPRDITNHDLLTLLVKPDGTVVGPRAGDKVDAPGGLAAYVFQDGDLDTSNADAGGVATKVQMVAVKDGPPPERHISHVAMIDLDMTPASAGPFELL